MNKLSNEEMKKILGYLHAYRIYRALIDDIKTERTISILKEIDDIIFKINQIVYNE